MDHFNVQQGSGSMTNDARLSLDIFAFTRHSPGYEHWGLGPSGDPPTSSRFPLHFPSFQSFIRCVPVISFHRYLPLRPQPQALNVTTHNFEYIFLNMSPYVSLNRPVSFMSLIRG